MQGFLYSLELLYGRVLMQVNKPQFWPVTFARRKRYQVAVAANNSLQYWQTSAAGTGLTHFGKVADLITN